MFVAGRGSYAEQSPLTITKGNEGVKSAKEPSHGFGCSPPAPSTQLQAVACQGALCREGQSPEQLLRGAAGFLCVLKSLEQLPITQN